MFFPTHSPKELTWDSIDAHKLREFLESSIGEKTLRILQDRIPPILVKGETNEVLLRAGEARGARYLFDSLISLVTEQPAELQPTPTPPPEAYPDLDTDKFWKEPEITPAP